ncbi:MAG TPA: hypothetical protein EYM39_08040, partial [Candidatus Latescibacteria bacterium]|nr:hypothetical protein [Candidatus Latescibacterota bacterium]
MNWSIQGAKAHGTWTVREAIRITQTSAARGHRSVNGLYQRATARSVALIGNPNTGKTTLFNALTG